MLTDDPFSDMLLLPARVGSLTEHDQEQVERVEDALADHASSGDPRDLDHAFVAARELLCSQLGADVSQPAGLDELRRLADDLPALGALLDRAADTAGEAVRTSCAELYSRLGVSGEAPRWSAAERDTARMVFACACGPVTAKSPEWLARSLRRITAARIARQICAELARQESVWTATLGDGYASLRHRCAPRTFIRSRGLADLLRADADCRAAVTARLERWIIAGGRIAELRAELEAAVVHVRTPARLA